MKKRSNSASIHDLLHIGFESILDDVDRAVRCTLDDFGGGDVMNIPRGCDMD